MNLFIAVFCGFLTMSLCQFDKTIDGHQFNKYYLYNPKPVNYTTAIDFCKQNGAQLVQPRSESEVDFIESNVTDGRRMYWIGTRVTNRTTPTTFLDGSRIDWIDWYPGYGQGQH